MYSKAGILLSLFAAAKLATASPPACLLAAINTQDEPGNLEVVCGANASELQDTLAELCDEDALDMALEAYDETCEGYGNGDATSSTMMTETMSSASSMTSMTSMSSTIAMTSTYYDEDCSCVTSSIVSTVIDMSYNAGASGTAGMPTGATDAVMDSPTDVADADADDDDDDVDADSTVLDGDGSSSGTGSASEAEFTGAAANNRVGSLVAAVAAIAFAAVAL